MIEKSKSPNKTILNSMIRRSRRTKPSKSIAYLVLYAFLYKYLSDNLKKYLLDLINGNEEDLKHFYSDFDEKQYIKEMALNDVGYFIEYYESYIDQLINDRYLNDFFISDFLVALKNNMVFSDGNPAEGYFNTIIDSIGNYSKFRLNQEEDLILLLNNYIYAISKLNISEKEFTYQQVYSQIAYSRIIDLSPTPEYISNILTRIISSQKGEALNVYDPFLRDASTLISLSKEINISNVYGKENSELNYIYSLINAFIEGFDFKNIFFFKQNAIESMLIDDASFDVIVSKIPDRFRNVHESTRKRQSLEIPKNSRNREFEDKFLSSFDEDQLNDKDLIEALKVIENKMAKPADNNIFHFGSEYESLSNSEFLFIINMLNSLNDNGIMAISVSQNFLFKNSLTSLRKFLTHENNYIDAIISLPEALGRSIRPEVIIVFRKNKNSDDIVFMDLSKDYGTAYSKNMVSGLMRRNLILDNDTLNKIVDVYSHRKTIDKFSQVVDLHELEKNNFNLTVSRYVDTYDGVYVKLEDLINEKEEITSRIRYLNKKIDSMMEDLNIKF